MLKMSTTGMNTSMQACWPLVNCVINQRLLEASLHMQQTLSQLTNFMKVPVTSYLRHMENKLVNSLLTEGIHSGFQICKKIIKIHQDFPEL